jgi:hypothetical protein
MAFTVRVENDSIRNSPRKFAKAQGKFGLVTVRYSDTMGFVEVTLLNPLAISYRKKMPKCIGLVVVYKEIS